MFSGVREFSLVMQSAKRHPDIFSVQGVGNRFAQRRFSYARRAVEAKYGRFHVATQLQHGQMFEDAVFYVFQAEVVFV